MYNYGPLTFDRPQVLSMNFMYDLPKVTSLGRKAQRILNDWELSGLVTFATGAPFTPTFTTTNGEDITGSSDGPRIVATCNPVLGRSQRTFNQEFNTSCFALPPVGTFGNAAPGMLYGPGINNFDMSLGKRIQLGSSDQRYLRFRAETFNTFNHTQFLTWNTAAQFNPTTGAQVNAIFGTPASARNPRTMQFSLKAVF
jgi:hypothetical protein